MAQRIAPDARIVYVDTGPACALHTPAPLLTSRPEGVTSYVDADMHDVELVLREAARTLDLSRPVAILFMAACSATSRRTLSRRAWSRRRWRPVPSGSYLALYDSAPVSPEVVEAARILERVVAALPYHLRSPARLARFFEGLELVGSPVPVPVTRWRPDSEAREVEQYGAVGRKP